MSTVDFLSGGSPEPNMDTYATNSQSMEISQPNYFDSVLSDPSTMDTLNGVYLLLQLVSFCFYAYFQYILSKKLEVKYSWMAWIPFLNFFNKLWIAGKTFAWWVKWFVIPFFLMILLGLMGTLMESKNILWIWVTLLSGVIIFAIVNLTHAISKRTGHGGWWTAGLIFAGWLFWPVTALHYEKGDEITPRPFTGWKKGLLIFFAVIIPALVIFFLLLSFYRWILAAII